jgi:3-dehydroquinate synthase
MSVVRIELPHCTYDVLIEPGALTRLGEVVRACAPHKRCGLLADPAVAQPWGELARQSLVRAGYGVAQVALEPGEKHKTLAAVERIYGALAEARLERRSPLIALGGGVTGDTVGFVAATWLRGVPFVQCPTTLLAMVDASVGGKVGVNLPAGKNLVGAFYQPVAVVIDPRVLGTLPARELGCGLAESIKHGVLGDPALLDLIERRMSELRGRDPQALAELVHRNVVVKAGVVMRDERESGERAHLNLGHTFAHAIEATMGYGELLHGEAVGLGLIAAAELAHRTGLCGAPLVARLRALVAAAGLPLTAALPDDEVLWAAMQRDKKVADDRLRFVLPEREGRVRMRDDLSRADVSAAWRAIRA